MTDVALKCQTKYYTRVIVLQNILLKVKMSIELKIRQNNSLIFTRTGSSIKILDGITFSFVKVFIMFFFSITVIRCWPNVNEEFTSEVLWSEVWMHVPQGTHPEKLGGGVRPASQNPQTYLWPKSATFPTLFMTCPKIRNLFMTRPLHQNPVSDLRYN